MNKEFFKNEIKGSIYLGWKGLGPILGTRYYFSIDNKVLKLISRSPFKG